MQTQNAILFRVVVRCKLKDTKLKDTKTREGYILKIALIVILGVVALAFLFREPLAELAKSRVTSDMFVQQDNDEFNPGIAVGEPFPAIKAISTQGPIEDISALLGTEGAVIVLIRSVDWWPFCQRQLVQLQQDRALFTEAGLNIISISYDSPALQAAFAKDYGITFALLSDVEAQTVKALGILNQDYSPGDGAYGIPYPGIYVVDRNKMIRGKIFLESYNKRLDAKAVFEFVMSLRANWDQYAKKMEIANRTISIFFIGNFLSMKAGLDESVSIMRLIIVDIWPYRYEQRWVNRTDYLDHVWSWWIHFEFE